MSTGADESIAVHLVSVMRELDLIRARHPEYFAHESGPPLKSGPP